MGTLGEGERFLLAGQDLLSLLSVAFYLSRLVKCQELVNLFQMKMILKHY